MAGPYLTNPLEQINQAWQQGRNMAFQEQAGKALTTTGADQQQALTQAAQLNPTGSLDLAQKTQQVGGQRLVSMAKFLLNAPPEQRDAAYQAMKPTLGQLGIDPSTLPANYDDTVAQTAQSLVGAYTPYNAVPAAVRTLQYIGKDLSPEEQQQQLRIRAGLDPRASKANYTPGNIPDGRGGQIQAVFNHQTGKWEPSDYSQILTPEQQNAPAPIAAGQASTAAGGVVQPTTPGTTLPNVNDAFLPFIQKANERVANGEDPNVVQADLVKQKQAFDAQQAALGGGSATAGAGATGLAGGLGYTPAKPDKNEIDKRVADLKALEDQGVHLSPEQRNQYLLTGKSTQEGGELTPGDTTKQGGDYLSTLDPAMAKQVKALAEGRMAFPSGVALSKPYWQAMLGAVSQYDPSFDATNYNARNATLRGFSAGKEAQTVNALNTVAEHLGTLSDYADKLNNTQIPLVNRIANTYLAETGDPRIAQFETARKAAADEVAKVWRNTGGSQADIEENLKNLDGAQSPAQLHAAIGTLVKLIGGKLSALQDQYKQGMGTAAQRQSLVSPGAQKAFSNVLQKAGMENDIGGESSLAQPGAEAAPASSNEPARPTSQAEFDALPSGAMFINPKDGQLMRKH